MQVKVFESIDMASGLKMIKKELGPDALIISTRTVRNGKLGILGKPTLEITAAIDSGMETDKDYTVTPETFRLESVKQTPGFNHVVDQPLDHLLQQHLPDQKSIHTDFSFSPSPETTASKNLLVDDVHELKKMVKDLSGEISRISIASARQKEKDLFTSSGDRTDSQEKKIISMLRDRGINGYCSRKISSLLFDKLSAEELDNPELVTSTIITVIQSFLRAAPPVLLPSDNQHRIALVGPTGVGKTTTLAKIAASFLTGHSPSVALITIDTYRIAAVEQLKVYGEIMHLPVDVVITPDQLKQAIEKHRDKDLILIDTAGRSPKDELCIRELSTFLSPELNIDKHLVLSATTRESELFNTIERFNTVGITHTIFTKIDECANLGVLVNIQIQNSNPLSFVTNGQRVPEDLVEISNNRVAELIMSQHEGPLHD